SFVCGKLPIVVVGKSGRENRSAWIFFRASKGIARVVSSAVTASGAGNGWAAKNRRRASADARYAASASASGASARARSSAGRLGRKAGHGFYAYTDEAKER
ncbi:hypothetical protein AB1399_10880, partial [Hydrogenibacillus schlegelii]|uniref:hypothetical protein n=1 Tax=Hydrogenibacillus schlegelii TaxID=1484 RepID=UPI0034A0A36B